MSNYGHGHAKGFDCLPDAFHISWDLIKENLFLHSSPPLSSVRKRYRGIWNNNQLFLNNQNLLVIL